MHRSKDLQPRVFVATAALFFMVLNYVRLPFYLAADLFSWQQLPGIVWVHPWPRSASGSAGCSCC